MLEMRTIDDVGMTHDLCRERGLVLASLGRHMNDRMFSFFLRAPGDWALELGWGGREIDPASWQTQQYDWLRPGHGEWGHEGIDNVR